MALLWPLTLSHPCWLSSPSLHQSGEARLGCGTDLKMSVALNSKGFFLAHITCPLWDYFTTWAAGCWPPHSWPCILMGLTIQGLISSKCWHCWGLGKRRTNWAQALKGFCLHLIGQSKSRELGTLKGSPMLSGKRTENICLQHRWGTHSFRRPTNYAHSFYFYSLLDMDVQYLAKLLIS